MFKKISELSSKDSSKLKTYWTELWGAEYASAIVENYTTDAKTKDVEAKGNKQTKVAIKVQKINI